MPSLARPGGVELHWEERGEGPLVLFLHHWYAYPAVYQGLLDDLSRDHRVVTYDQRGTGESTRQGPYSSEVDDEDLVAVAEELGRGAVAVGQGDGRYRATRVARMHPHLIHAVVSCGATIAAEPGTEGPSGSAGVRQAIVELAGASPRAALREMLALTNPEMTEEELQSRLDATVEYHSPEALRARGVLFNQTMEDAIEAARAIGDRFWIAYWESAWGGPRAAEVAREALPEARLCSVPDGPISRPDATADVVRQAVRASR
jgi:pimeloyl-ACP methyl ester carboxylesterase